MSFSMAPCYRQGMIATLQSVRVARGFTRVEFLRTLRAITGREIKRTLRSWESKQVTVPAWVVDAYRATLKLTDEEVAAVVGWAASASASLAAEVK